MSHSQQSMTELLKLFQTELLYIPANTCLNAQSKTLTLIIDRFLCGKTNSRDE
uniref:Uncharacterized protein n=1 Tax=Anguilla anguilla TaxID=7936 RepID=A0A0E9S1X2_ANGAN